MNESTRRDCFGKVSQTGGKEQAASLAGSGPAFGVHAGVLQDEPGPREADWHDDLFESSGDPFWGNSRSCKTRMVPLWLRGMASITLKDTPMELHAQLKNEAAANFRSITQEAMSRLERTFQIDAALTTRRDQQWIDEAIASGPATPLTKKEMDAIRDRVLRGKK